MPLLGAIIIVAYNTVSSASAAHLIREKAYSVALFINQRNTLCSTVLLLHKSHKAFRMIMENARMIAHIFFFKVTILC